MLQSAHNYLAEPEIREKNRLSVMLLDFFEDRVDIGKLTLMSHAEAELDRFIEFNDRVVLRSKGKMKRSTADKHAHCEYEKFLEIRRQARLD